LEAPGGGEAAPPTLLGGGGDAVFEIGTCVDNNGTSEPISNNVEDDEDEFGGFGEAPATIIDETNASAAAESDDPFGHHLEIPAAPLPHLGGGGDAIFESGTSADNKTTLSPSLTTKKMMTLEILEEYPQQ
jgi:hypothetical protein